MNKLIPILIIIIGFSIVVYPAYSQTIICHDQTIIWLPQVDGMIECLDNRTNDLQTQIDNIPVGGSESTICSNVGNGRFIHITSTNCDAKSLVGSPDISVTNTSNTIVIDFNGTAGGESTVCTNQGSGFQIFKDGNCNFRTVLGSPDISVTQQTNTLTIDFNGTGGLTHNLLSSTHTDTTANSPVLGDMIVGDATPKWIRFAKGTLGETLHLESSNVIPTWEYDDVTTHASSATLTLENDYIEVTMGANRVINLPASNSTTEGKTFIIKRIIGSGILTIEPSGSQLIDGYLNYNMTNDDQWVIITSQVRVDWGIVGKSSSPATVSQVYLSLVKTNIGTGYIDIYATAFDEENQNIIDCNSVDFFRFVYQWDYVGVGTQQLRWVNVADNTQVLYESPTFTTDRDAIDSGWIQKPSWCVSNAITIEWQGKSTTGADDPITKGYKIMVR